MTKMVLKLCAIDGFVCLRSDICFNVYPVFPMLTISKATIRPAEVADSEKLTEISFASKRYWQYPESYMQIWKDELTLSREYIAENDVWVYERDGLSEAYYSIVRLEHDKDFDGYCLQKGYWLEHMFVNPGLIGCGIGTRLFDHIKAVYGNRSIREIYVLADPHARGFYEKMGLKYGGEFPSSIPGRTTPLMVIHL